MAYARVAAANEGEGEAQPEPEAKGEAKEAEEEGEKPFSVGLDPVLGWGTVPFAAQDRPAAGTQQSTYSRDDATRTVVESFIVGGAWETRGGLAFGARVPFSFGTFSPADSGSRSTAAFGNVEVEGEYAAHLGEKVELSGAIGVALPTAQGDEIPDDLSHAPAGTVDPAAFDRFSLSRAAAFARGYEDNALFEPRRVGMIPKATLSYRTGGLIVVPYVKVENLLGPSSAASAGYVGELVPGLKVGYRLGRAVEVGLRGWANVGFAGTAEDKTTSAAIEPRLGLVVGPVNTYAGLMMPLAGPPSDAGFLALRLGATVAF
jgi:hypothetical protein